jgi:ssDNA-binding Zn-finger/Zn-ribbon topoisomerase 1
MTELKKGQEVTVPCPNCGIDTRLVVRVNKKNGLQFLGCPNWPQCDHTQNVPDHIRMEALGAPKLFDV